MPTYKEITSSKKGKERAHDDYLSDEDAETGKPERDLSDEDEFDDVVDRFESSYNFRFEEPYVILNLQCHIRSSNAVCSETPRRSLATLVTSLLSFVDKIPLERKHEKDARPAKRRNS